MFSLENVAREEKYLTLLSESYPTAAAASAEIINLSAIMNLPKATEHFISDIHGEYEVFNHIMKNASGAVKRKIESCFGDTISNEEKNLLATIIYYPQEKLNYLKTKKICTDEWYHKILMQLIMVCRIVTSKYSRSKVRKALPKEFSYIIEELMYTDNFEINKHEYFDKILDSIIKTSIQDAFITGLSGLIQKLIVDKLHIIGDIFDRGWGAHLVMEDLYSHSNVDIQWGNHDVVWMAAARGHHASIANVIRNSLKYNNFNCLEEGYGINTRPLAVFAMEVYRNDPCASFRPKPDEVPLHKIIKEADMATATKVHKAITIIQLKLEGQIIKNRPEFMMENRLLLDKIDPVTGEVTIDGVTYTVNDLNFPTVDPSDPYKLSEEEQSVIEQLAYSFTHSKLLQKHINFLFQKGSMYLIHNNNLMYHGCIPMLEDGSFASATINGVQYSGSNYLDVCDKICRLGGFSKDVTEKTFALDFMWYLWCGYLSPLNGKTKMTNFERAFINDPESHVEPKDFYYKHIENRLTAELILREFGITARNSHIVNGHVPVMVSKGESPIKASGKLLIIDGGISKAYQKSTGISGYTLISNSYELQISEHQPFESVNKVIETDDDMHSKNITVDRYENRLFVMDTDNGTEIQKKISDLELLLQGFRSGIIKQIG